MHSANYRDTWAAMPRTGGMPLPSVPKRLLGKGLIKFLHDWRKKKSFVALHKGGLPSVFLRHLANHVFACEFFRTFLCYIKFIICLRYWSYEMTTRESFFYFLNYLCPNL
jgi:hypothetical protein